MSKERKICPMTHSSIDNQLNKECIEEKCAWWTVYLQNTNMEWAECAICALGRLYDIEGR